MKIWNDNGETIDVEVGDDVTDFLRVRKYNPPIPANLVGQVRGFFPSFIRKTDSHRLQSYPALIDEMQGVECYVTIKVDGTSTTAYRRVTDMRPESDWYSVCSRNMDLKPGNTTYHSMVQKYDMHGHLDRLGRNLAFQFETYGEGIQANRLGIKGHDVALFDVFDIDKQRYLDYGDAFCIANACKIPTAHVVFVGKFAWKSVDELVNYATAFDYPNGTPVEGIVIRPVIETYSYVLGGRLAFKVISPRFLIKYGE